MNEENKIVIYQTEDGQTRIDVRLENDTVWLTQAQMAELFQKDQSVIARHINNAVKEGELKENSNMQFLHNTQYKYRPTRIYDLDAIICVGYRVHSKRGTAFRIWARQILKDYLIKGYAVNERAELQLITEEQKQQLMATTLTTGMNAWEFTQSRPEESRPWIAAGILSCIEKDYRLDLLMIGWETREIRSGQNFG